MSACICDEMIDYPVAPPWDRYRYCRGHDETDRLEARVTDLAKTVERLADALSESVAQRRPQYTPSAAPPPTPKPPSRGA